MADVSDVADLYRQTREHCGISVRELARRSEVSPTTIQLLERGQDCRLSIWKRVGLQLGITIQFKAAWGTGRRR